MMLRTPRRPITEAPSEISEGSIIARLCSHYSARAVEARGEFSTDVVRPTIVGRSDKAIKGATVPLLQVITCGNRGYAHPRNAILYINLALYCSQAMLGGGGGITK